MRSPGVIPPAGLVGVPGVSGGFAPGGDELEGGVVAGDVVELEGAADDEDDDPPPPGGAAAWAPAATRPIVATSTMDCNLAISFTSLVGICLLPIPTQLRYPVSLESAARVGGQRSHGAFQRGVFVRVGQVLQAHATEGQPSVV